MRLGSEEIYGYKSGNGHIFNITRKGALTVFRSFEPYHFSSNAEPSRNYSAKGGMILKLSWNDFETVEISEKSVEY